MVEAVITAAVEVEEETQPPAAGVEAGAPPFLIMAFLKHMPPVGVAEGSAIAPVAVAEQTLVEQAVRAMGDMVVLPGLLKLEERGERAIVPVFLAVLAAPVTLMVAAAAADTEVGEGEGQAVPAAAVVPMV